MTGTAARRRQFGFVTCVNDAAVLHRRMLASPCLAQRGYEVAIYNAAASAADAFNPEMRRHPNVQWLVWMHQDVYLPQGWDVCFAAAIDAAEARFPGLAVVGVYGISGAGDTARRVGRLLDRGAPLEGTELLPCLVDSVDELLFAVRTDTGLLLDPALGFDFYGTDLCLTAQAAGFKAAVVDAYCEHWSPTPQATLQRATLERIAQSGEVFEKKWAHRLPVDTPCCSIGQVGDLRRMVRELGSSS